MKAVCAICLALFVAGCGVYSFSSSSLGGVKTVAVPQFENKTVEYGIQEDLTAKVIDRLIADNALRVVALADADAVLSGEIVKYERVAYTYDKGDNVSEYKVNIYVSFTLVRKGGKSLLEKSNMLGFGVYQAAGQTEDDGKREAIDKLARDIVDETTKTW
jgi:outer membrane lipopolysaccharide assembly protein LptE/RlpB